MLAPALLGPPFLGTGLCASALFARCARSFAVLAVPFLLCATVSAPCSVDPICKALSAKAPVDLPVAHLTCNRSSGGSSSCASGSNTVDAAHHPTLQQALPQRGDATFSGQTHHGKPLANPLAPHPRCLRPKPLPPLQLSCSCMWHLGGPLSAAAAASPLTLPLLRLPPFR